MTESIESKMNTINKRISAIEESLVAGNKESVIESVLYLVKTVRILDERIRKYIAEMNKTNMIVQNEHMIINSFLQEFNMMDKYIEYRKRLNSNISKTSGELNNAAKDKNIKETPSEEKPHE